MGAIGAYLLTTGQSSAGFLRVAHVELELPPALHAGGSLCFEASGSENCYQISGETTDIHWTSSDNSSQDLVDGPVVHSGLTIWFESSDGARLADARVADFDPAPGLCGSGSVDAEAIVIVETECEG